MEALRSKNAKLALLVLTIGALGVVYGDIGTSPLYTVNEIFFSQHSTIEPTSENVIRAISLIFWALTLLISIEYIALVLRADYHGEGGVFALLALVGGATGRKHRALVGFLMLAAGLLYGDGIITPAISILSAVEGLKVATPTFEPYIVPIALLILTGLFLAQRHGTGKVGALFGPIVALWLMSIGTLGSRQIMAHPQILKAVNPLYAMEFFIYTDWHTIFTVLGSVMLAVTGGEALYADLGHFGKKPIRIGWFLAYPCLLLNYFGQGAFLLSGKQIVEGNVFYSTVPTILLYPMVALATAATVIASQALITGAFSLTSQATALGLIPRFLTIHTSPDHRGQIYQPFVNWTLYVGCVTLVIVFKSSTHLAAAYGLAVSGVMCATAISIRRIAIEKWSWSPKRATVIFGFFTVVCSSFLIANSLKFMHGGYLPIFIGSALFILMATWKYGRSVLAGAYAAYGQKTIEWLNDLRRRLDENNGRLQTGMRELVETNRVFIFLVSKKIKDETDLVPVTLRAHLKCHGSMPWHLVFLNLDFINSATIPKQERFEIIRIGKDVWSVTIKFGFMEVPDVPKAISQINDAEIFTTDINISTFVVGAEEIIINEGKKIRHWVMRLFRFINRITYPAHYYFGLRDPRLDLQLVPIVVSKNGTAVKLPERDIAAE